MPAFSSLDAARAVLGLARLLHLSRYRARLRGQSLAGGDPSASRALVIVGRRLSAAVRDAERAPRGSPAQRAAIRRAAAASEELISLVRMTDGLARMLETGVEQIRRPPTRPPARQKGR